MDHCWRCHHRWHRRRDNSQYRRRTAHTTKPPRRHAEEILHALQIFYPITSLQYHTISTSQPTTSYPTSHPTPSQPYTKTVPPYTNIREPLFSASITQPAKFPPTHVRTSQSCLSNPPTMQEENISSKRTTTYKTLPRHPNYRTCVNQSVNGNGANQEMSITRSGHQGGHVKGKGYGMAPLVMGGTSTYKPPFLGIQYNMYGIYLPSLA